MAQDIREMFRNRELKNKTELKQGHQKRFEDRLDALGLSEKPTTPVGKSSLKFQILKIAAVVIVALGVSLFFLLPDRGNTDAVPVVNTSEKKNPDKDRAEEYQLSDASPEFKKIENYYLASLNIQLAKLEINKENKQLIDAFMVKLEELDKEYKRLNVDIKEFGLNGETVEAMITNLQLRLDMLKNLKNKLKELEQSKNNRYENHQA